MADLVVTCPKGFWWEWIAEGDAVGQPYTGEEWGWYMAGRRPDIAPGDRLYIVAWGRLRGYAPVTALRGLSFDPRRGAQPPSGVWVGADTIDGAKQWCICRKGDAVAVTIPQSVPGFRGWRRRWWRRENEVAFPDWGTAGVEIKRRAA
jgi:hypothetical protein